MFTITIFNHIEDFILYAAVTLEDVQTRAFIVHLSKVPVEDTGIPGEIFNIQDRADLAEAESVDFTFNMPELELAVQSRNIAFEFDLEEDHANGAVTMHVRGILYEGP